MKRMLCFVCMLLSMQVLSAQIITSAQVAEVKKEKKVWDKEPHEKGWRGFAEIAYTIDAWGRSGMDLMATYGYQFNNWVYAGVGGGILMSGIDGFYADLIHLGTDWNDYFVGIDKEGEEYAYMRYDNRNWDEITTPKYSENQEFDYHTVLFSLPLYANMRAFFLSTKVKPFTDIKLGGMIPLGSRELFYKQYTCRHKGDHNYAECPSLTRAKYRYGGIYFQWGFGAEYRNYSLSFNYALKGYTALLLNDANEVVDKERNVNPATFTFNFGYSF